MVCLPGNTPLLMSTCPKPDDAQPFSPTTPTPTPTPTSKALSIALPVPAVVLGVPHKGAFPPPSVVLQVWAQRALPEEP